LLNVYDPKDPEKKFVGEGIKGGGFRATDDCDVKNLWKPRRKNNYGGKLRWTATGCQWLVAEIQFGATAGNQRKFAERRIQLECGPKPDDWPELPTTSDLEEQLTKGAAGQPK